MNERRYSTWLTDSLGNLAEKVTYTRDGVTYNDISCRSTVSPRWEYADISTTVKDTVRGEVMEYFSNMTPADWDRICNVFISKPSKTDDDLSMPTDDDLAMLFG